jgi:hypothetical protein
MGCARAPWHWMTARRMESRLPSALRALPGGTSASHVAGFSLQR